MTEAQRIGSNLKAARKRAGLTQPQLAEKVGIHQNSYSRYENGTRQPSFELLIRICKELHIVPGDIMQPTDKAAQAYYEKARENAEKNKVLEKEDRAKKAPVLHRIIDHLNYDDFTDIFRIACKLRNSEINDAFMASQENLPADLVLAYSQRLDAIAEALFDGDMPEEKAVQ